MSTGSELLQGRPCVVDASDPWKGSCLPESCWPVRVSGRQNPEVVVTLLGSSLMHPRKDKPGSWWLLNLDPKDSNKSSCWALLVLQIFYNFYLFIFGCTGFSLLGTGFL